jgi:hypothetical protein
MIIITTKNLFLPAFAAFLSALLPFATASAAVTPDLGDAYTYGVLTDTTFTITTTTINGDLGYTTIVGIPDAVIGTTNAANAAFDSAIIDKDAAKMELDAEACDYSTGAAVDLFNDATHYTFPNALGSLNVYYPGVYCITGALSQSGSITLEGAGTYIFRTPGAFAPAAGSVINLSDGALSSDVFWRATVTTLGAGSFFVGTVMDNTAVTLSAAVTVDGRIFAPTITTTSSNITAPIDVTIPVITLAGAASQNIEAGTAYSELGATALDNIDGDITGSIVIDATEVDVNTVGAYVVTYDVDDAAHNSAVQVTRTVNITADVTLPVITLVGAAPQNIEVGTAYLELGATALDNLDGLISGSIVIDASAVNTNAVGAYSVTYNVIDAAGNAAVQVTRTVNITADVTIPIIIWVGANPQDIQVGRAYIELGAAAIDNIDGVISGSIVIDASAVNTNAIGAYSVTYNINDAAGNAAVQVTRTVNIIMTSPGC